MSCFINKNISGVDNLSSNLNEELKSIFPLDIGINNSSTHYLDLRRDGGAYKNAFPVDWETKEGQDYINKNHPGFLGEQGEPKLFVDKVGRAYFKTPEYNRYINDSSISEGERNENVKAIMASYVENPSMPLKLFIKETTRKNINELNSILNNTYEEIDDLADLYNQKGVSSSEKSKIKSRISYLKEDAERLNDSIAFLLSANNNEPLLNILFHDVKLALEGAKIAYEDDPSEREKDEANSSMDLSFLRPSNETNPLNSLAPEILQLMSTIPKTNFKFNENGIIATHEKSVSSVLPLLTYIHDYNEVTKEVQSIVSDTVAVDLKVSPEDYSKADKDEFLELKSKDIRNATLFYVMYDKLQANVDRTNNPKIQIVLEKLDELINSKKSEQDKEDVRSKFVKSFHKSKSNNIMHTSNESLMNFGEGEGTKMININKIDLSSNKTRRDSFAEEMTNKAFLMLNSPMSEEREALIDKLFLDIKRKNSFYENKESLKNILEAKYGLTLSDLTVSQLIKQINNSKDSVSRGNKGILMFLDNLEKLNSLIYNVHPAIEKGKKKGEYNIKNIAKEYIKQDANGKALIIDNFVENGGNPTEIGIIADLEYINSPSYADSSIASGSKKMWMYSFMSKMHKDILTWKAGDTSDLRSLLNTGNGMVDFLLAMDEKESVRKKVSQKRINDIKINNHIELRKKMDSSPEVFNSLTEEDLLLLTFSNLYENRKEKYIEREQGGTNKTGKNISLGKMIEEKETANEFTFLNNVDKSQTTGLAGVLLGNSRVDVDSNGTITSIGTNNIERIKKVFKGELYKIEEIRKTINEYNEIPSSTKEQRIKKLSFSVKNFIPGWHYAKVFVNDKNENEEVDTLNENYIIPKQAFVEGNYRKFGFLNGFYHANKRKIDQTYFVNDSVNDTFWANDSLGESNFDLDNAIDNYFMEILQKEKDGLIKMTGASETSYYNGAFTETIPRKGLFEIQTSVIHDNLVINEHKAASDFLMNYMFHSIDLFTLFNGEIGLYKQSGEFNLMEPLKRTSAVNADGIYANNPNPLELDEYIPFGNQERVKFFKNTKTIFAVIKAQKYKSSYYSPIINRLIKDNENEENNKKKNNNIEVSGEVSDGASYANPKFLFDFYKRTYGISEKEEKLHKELMDPNTLPNEAHFKFLKKLGGSNQSAKLQAFSLLKKADGTRLPFFWKSSVLPLYPSLTNGFQIDKLRLQMEKQNIGVVGNDSAFKNSIHAPVGIFNKNNEDGTLGLMLDNFDLNPFEVDTADIKIQVELKMKGDKPNTVVGAQPLRNVMANVDLESEDKAYSYRGTSLTGKEMMIQYDNNIKSVVQNQLDYFLNKIEYKENGSFNEEVFRKMLTDQFDDLDFDLKDIVENTEMPLETIPGMSNRLFPILTSYIEKNVAKPKTNGTAAIQVPNTGFNDLDQETKSGAILFNSKNQLAPPKPTSFMDYRKRMLKTENGLDKVDALFEYITEYNKGKKASDQFDIEQSPLYFSKDNPDLVSLSKIDGYFSSIENGQIMLNFSSLFVSSKMTWTEFQEFATERDVNGNLVNIDQEVLSTLVGYRIPNQSMSSNDAFEVVGILPPSAGDIAVMYHEITAKTGSDFDIDKMVLMLPNFEVIYKKQDESKLSKTNRNAIEESVKNNPANKYMKTNNYSSENHIYSVLFKNEKLLDLANNNNFYKKSPEERLEFFIDNRKEISYLLEKDHRKAINKTDFEFSIRDTLDDLYESIDERNEVVNSELEERGFKARNRYVASEIKYISDDSEKGMQNRLIESISSILKSTKSFDDLISPLDGTHIKDSINETRYEYYIAETGGKEVLEKNRIIMSEEKIAVEKGEMKFEDTLLGKFLKSQETPLIAGMMPRSLAKSRTDMLMAKQLTATMANHMTNIPLSQINKVFLRYDIGLQSTSLSRTHILGKENDDKFKITKMVSYLMNASVDAAKDPYIILGNYNRYTSGAAMLFVRLGIDPKEASKILQHPLLIDISREKLGAKSKIAKISSRYTNTELEEMSYKLATRIKEGFRIKPESFMANIYELNDKTTPEKDKIGLTDEEILGFWHMAVTIGKDLNEAIKVSKPENAIKTIADFHAMTNRIEKMGGNSFGSVSDSKEIIGGGMVFRDVTEALPPFNQNITTKYNRNNDYVSGLKGSYVDAISNVNMSLINDLTTKKLIERTPGYIALLNNILINLGNGSSVDSDRIKRISSNLYPYVLSTSGNDLYNFIVSKEDGIDDIKDMLEKLPKDILLLKSFSKYSKNDFIKELYVDETRGFINFNNVANYTPASKIAIKDGANSLYSNKDTRGIIERAAKYSFFTTGFKPSSYSFANYLPKSFFVDIKHNESVDELLMKLNNADAYVKANLRGAMMFLASNRPEDDTINKVLKGSNIEISSGNPIRNESLIKKVTYIDPDTNEPHFYPFLSVVKRTTKKNYALVEVKKAKKGEQFDNPVYESINVMQYQSEGNFTTDETGDENSEMNEKEEIIEEEILEKELSVGDKGYINKKTRSSRLILFNPSLANSESLFSNKNDYKLLLRETNNNVELYNSRVLFGLNKSEEAKAGEKERAAYLEGLTKNNYSSPVKKLVTEKNSSKVELFKGFWNRAEVEKQKEKVFLFGDNTDDRLNTKYVPSSTQAVIRGLPNAIGIDTKKNRGTGSESYFSDSDFDEFKRQVDYAIQEAVDSGKTIVIPADGIGTGKAMLKEKAPTLFDYLNQKLNELRNPNNNGFNSNVDTHKALVETDSLSSEEIAEYQKIIDYFYSQDNDQNAKQKAQNELNKYKECKL